MANRNGDAPLGTPARGPLPDDALICPSARCEEGAVVLGIIGGSGTVGYISPALPVSAEFAEHVRRDGSPERRFRFAAPCQRSGCENWTAGRCGVIDDALTVAADIDVQSSEGHLPRCSIRRSCRWFAQNGADACKVCPFMFNHVWPTDETERADESARG